MIRRLSLPVLASALCALPAPAIAKDETRASADVSTSVGYALNPYGGTNSDSGSGFVDVLIRPKLVIASPTRSWTLDGDIQLQQYFRNYSLIDNYRAAVAYDARNSARFQTRARLEYQDQLIGAFNSLAVTAAPTQVPVTGEDLGLFGQRSRRRSVSGNAGVDIDLSPVSTLSVNGFGAYASYTQLASLSDYTSYGGSVAYSRAISAFTKIGISAGASIADYRGPRPTSSAYFGEATLSARFSPRWTVDGALGATVIDDGLQSSRVEVSGNLSLCRAGEATRLCIDARRSALPSGVVGTQIQTSAGLDYSYRFSKKDTIGFVLSYNRTDGQAAELTAGNQYFSSSLSYGRKLSQRFQLTSSGYYRRIFGGTTTRGDDYGGLGGISYRFGDLR